MAASVGRAIALTWGGAAVPGVREKSVAMNGEPVNVTDGDDEGWRVLLEDEAAESEVSITISGVTKSPALRQAWLTGERTAEVVITYPDGDTLTGTFFLQSYTDTGPYNDATTFEATLLSSGAPEYEEAETDDGPGEGST